MWPGTQIVSISALICGPKFVRALSLDMGIPGELRPHGKNGVPLEDAPGFTGSLLAPDTKTLLAAA